MMCGKIYKDGARGAGQSPAGAQDAGRQARSGQGLEEIEGAVGRWDNDMGSVVYVKQDGKWVDAVQGKNCDTDGLHYEFNLQGRKVIVSIDDNANFEIGDTDGFEEVRE